MRFLVFIGVTKFSSSTKSTPLKVNQSLINHPMLKLLKWSFMKPVEGLEPTTYSLQNCCASHCAIPADGGLYIPAPTFPF